MDTNISISSIITDDNVIRDNLVSYIVIVAGFK